MTRTYPLRPRWGALIGGLLLFGGGALFLGWRAATNDRGLILNGILEFGVDGAKKFYAVMAVLSLAMAGLVVIATIRVLGGSQVVIIDDDAVTIPGALFQAAKRIHYREISKLELQTIAGQDLLRVTHAAGRHAIVSGQVGEATFREIVERIEGRVEYHRSHA